MRDRLFALINEAKDEYPTIPSVNCCKPTFAYYLAGHLLTNGVIVPPCKVGDVVYSPRENSILEQNVISIEIEKDSHVRVYFTCDYLCDGCPHEQTYQNQAGDGGCWGEYGESLFAFEDFGKTVFLTREEAERALKGEHHAEIH
jgi:hypothetical protein